MIARSTPSKERLGSPDSQGLAFCSARKNGAFTLIELLVVIVIIGVLMVMGPSLLKQDSGVSTSLSVVESFVEEARSRAVGKQIRTRLVVHRDSTGVDSERNLRYYAIAQFKEDPDGVEPGVWEFSNGRTLPDGVYFDPDTAATVAATIAGYNPSTDDSEELSFGEWRTGTIDFPGAPETAQACIYLEFNEEGICIQEGSGAPGGVVVLSRGVPQENQDPTFDEEDKVGFAIMRSGGTSILRDTALLQN